ncbi:MAG TPA: C39 family peptidase [Candidatus Acidoferrum sp.]|nr:C39 family peptidase [Candidatus Acidoferrum sp.]
MRVRLSLTLLLLVPIVAMGAGGGVWLDVPFIHQEKEGCGSAALAMVLQYWSGKGAAVSPERSDPERIQRELYSKEEHGIRASEMERYFRDAGFQSFQFRGEWSDLANHLEKGRPLIACLQPGGKSPLHYVVVAGLDKQRDAVVMNDPQRGKLLRMERAEFEKEWRRTNDWTLLAVPKIAE